MIEQKIFGEFNGKSILAYTLKSDKAEVTVISFGAIVYGIKVMTAAGTLREITLGYADADGYIGHRAYYGATIGRVANRIENGTFTLYGKTYTLDKNNGTNCLHGGFDGYNRRLFDSRIEDNKVVFELTSADGDQGFPGTLAFKVTYALDGDTLTVDFDGISDKDTPWAPTNHTFFNLSGTTEPIDGTLLYINASAYTPIDGRLIPTGELRAVKGTPFDFTSAKRIGDGIHGSDEQLRLVGGGIDHNYALDGEHVARAEYNGVAMDIYSDMPGVQLYTGNFLKGDVLRDGTYGKHTAFCLEPQFFPNAINGKNDIFKKPILKAGEHGHHYIKYKFS